MRSNCALQSCAKAPSSRVFLEPRRMAEKALTAVVQEGCVQGVSTRSAGYLMQAMGMTGISKARSAGCVARSTTR